MAGKYQRRKPVRKHCRFLYILNAVVLILAAVKVFSLEPAEPDRSKNQHILTEAAALIEPDVCSPVIEGVQDILVYAGDTVAYRSGITVTDDRDDAPSLEVDSSLVDLTTPGSYTVTYLAEDDAGNRTSVAATITVLAAQAEHIQLQEVFDAVDAELENIVTENMTLNQQVRAIYEWAHTSFSYKGHSDRSDCYQAAYEMLTTRQGDCYGYFAVSKLMFERLGIPTIDVEKVKNHEEDSNHYWSLVSIDGGNTYYHFDCTPRLGPPFDFCLITDSQLDAYSAEHKFSHNRDRSLYPATPEE